MKMGAETLLWMRGRLERGYFADVVVFDPETVNSPASYETPTLQPRGICHVFRTGVEVLPGGFSA
jgi:N-acyl-D-aspartate/D-glutamate deacylase